ncbi:MULTISPECIES: transcription termination/antitermination protein NusG [unclassified Rhizobium]|uniref:transcription termination/antitermination protein NusG n=1 Tax=unclassified Rhizobium TaxID=2613769 RepID=UPI001ADAF0DF|nr:MULTISPECIES: transcription termination/antitermination protein NusG [unclassified Rhizobium]MBO9099986.1 KOW motif-containing protein [Rhizobium sp. L58/93]QXZ82797.1 KOW motif-containing protein [Rhizobium sp. K1/93]QXZ89690.1 KOW motif-containing protein [Rhizobium sp. K15/93]
MTMQHKRVEFQGGVVGGDRGLARLSKAAKLYSMRIGHLSMASKRVTARIIRDEPHLKPAWYCLEVAAKREFTVEKLLVDADVEVILPRCEGVASYRRGRLIRAPIIPVIAGYVMVRCLYNPAAMAGLLAVEGVKGIVGGYLHPHTVSDKDASRFSDKAVAGDYDYRAAAVTYYMGETVRVMDGPFSGFLALVIDVDKANACRILVEVEIFGRKTPIEMALAQVEKI